MHGYLFHCVYGDARITNGDEAWHSGVHIVHPDKSMTHIGSGYTSVIAERKTAAIDAWTARNPNFAELDDYAKNWS